MLVVYLPVNSINYWKSHFLLQNRNLFSHFEITFLKMDLIRGYIFVNIMQSWWFLFVLKLNWMMITKLMLYDIIQQLYKKLQLFWYYRIPGFLVIRMANIVLVRVTLWSLKIKVETLYCSHGALWFLLGHIFRLYYFISTSDD